MTDKANGPPPSRSFAMQWLLHGLAMLALGGVIGSQLYIEYGRADAMERERLSNQAQMIGQNLTRQLEAVHQALMGIRADPAHWRQASDPGPASERLKTLAGAMPGVRTITVLNVNGTVTTSNRADLVGENFGDRAYFATARRLADPDILVVSPPFRTSLGVFAMNLVMMLPGPNGEFAGVVSTTLNPEFFTTLLKSALYTPDMWSALVHGGGLQFLMVPEHAGQSGRNLLEPGSFFSRHRDSGQTVTVMTGTVHSTGEERMLAQITIKPASVPMDTPLVVAVSRDFNVIHSEWRRDALHQATLYLLLLVVSSLGLFYLHRRQHAFDRNVAQTTQALEEARHQAEAANLAKSAFLATMSHEIRTPITSVLGMADLLRSTTLNREQAGYVDTLSSSTRALLAILNDILDISKIEAGKITVEALEFQLHPVFRDVVSLCLSMASAKGLVLGLDIQPDVPARVVGDSTRLRQVLFNLVSNAIKFTETGSVRLRLSIETRDGKARDDKAVVIRCDVEDTGIGIARDEIDRLFRPFSQVDSSTTRRFGGTGLGLAITRRLLDLMGGEIGVVSAPGQGATFWFTMPFTMPDRHDPIEQAPPPSPLLLPPADKPLSILVAEDNRINQMLVRSMLQKFGHTVRVVENGRLALDAVIAEDFDAVLMDMQMPEMDGEEATRLIRALPPPKNRTPVLALTADVMVEHRARYLGAGVNALVPKPIDWRILSEALKAHTGAAAGVSPRAGEFR